MQALANGYNDLALLNISVLAFSCQGDAVEVGGGGELWPISAKSSEHSLLVVLGRGWTN